MKKLWFFIIISVVFQQNAVCQNLIDNPYFDIDSIYYGGFNSPFFGGWSATQQGGIRFHTSSCVPNPPTIFHCLGKNSLPIPKFREGYYSIFLTNNSLQVATRGFISSYLTQPLLTGEEYVIEYYYRPYPRNNYHIDRIGVYVGNDTVFDYNYTNYSPQVEFISPITDTTKWSFFSQSFIAQGGERRITLGNFYTKAQTTLIPNPPYTNAPWPVNNGRWPMVFIDGVFVYKATDTLYTVSLPQDTLLCPGETLDLVAVLDSGFKLQDTVTTYLWNTGSTDSTISVSQPGTYWVQTTINKRFVQTDTIMVNYFDANYTLGLPDSVGFCENEDANVLANLIPQTHYYWSNGDTTRGIRIGYSTTLQLTAVTPCYTLQESVKVYQKQCEVYIYIPNAFTPNGDGNNDFFAFYGVPEPVSLIVFDRWGGIVYQNQDYKNEWDGTSLSGDTLPAGVYSYVIEYKYINPNATVADPEGSTQQIRGTVNLVR